MERNQAMEPSPLNQSGLLRVRLEDGTETDLFLVLDPVRGVEGDSNLETFLSMMCGPDGDHPARTSRLYSTRDSLLRIFRNRLTSYCSSYLKDLATPESRWMNLLPRGPARLCRNLLSWALTDTSPPPVDRKRMILQEVRELFKSGDLTVNGEDLLREIDTVRIMP